MTLYREKRPKGPIKKAIKPLMPGWMLAMRVNYMTARKLVLVHNLLTDRTSTKAVFTIDVLVRLLWPRRTLSFHPELPRPKSVIFDLCACLRYKVVRGPSARTDCEVLFKRATYIDIDRAAEGAIDFSRTLNGNCRNISKKHVQQCFSSVFGYSLDLDPTSHRGEILRKSNLNYRHDGRIMASPVADSEVDARYVYQKVIDNEDADGYFIDYRVPVFGNEIPVVYKKYRPPETRFKDVLRAEITDPEDVFSSWELNRILRFSRLLQLDFGELDVLRDNSDGRIYIVDANSTPFHASIPEETRKEALRTLAPAFERLVRAMASGGLRRDSRELETKGAGPGEAVSVSRLPRA